MYPDYVAVSDKLKEAHTLAWQTIAQPGDFFTGAQRVAMVRSAREALTCALCEDKKAALSPNAVDGEHEDDTDLNPAIVDMIHRMRSDPGRLTKAWFDGITQAISKQQYVEIVSVVNSSVIIDTLHNALGLGLPRLPQPQGGQPRGQHNASAVQGGAWVPILDADETMADTGLPQVPNIARSLGLVPSAGQLFFTTFRPHYALKDIDLSITQGQAEFVASRVSAINECYY
jgi:hypothetical protein